MRYHAALLALTTLLLVGLLPAQTPRPSPPPARAAELATLPAPVPGAPTPSMALSVSAGYAGQSVVVSGEGVPGLPGVRVVWLLADATYAAALPSLDAAGRYRATISVPPEAALGPAQICVAASGTERAAFSCADFTVQEPPPASLDIRLPAGTVPAGAALQQAGAIFSLLNMAGATVASAPVQADGRVQIASVPPGVYQPIISGQVSRLSEFTPLELGPAETITTLLPLSPAVRRVDPVTKQSCDNSDALVAAVGALYSNAGTFTPPRPGSAPGSSRAGYAAYQAGYYGPNRFYDPRAGAAQQPQLGWYVSGVAAPNQFQASVQSRFVNSVQRVEVWRRDAGAERFAKVADVQRVDGRFIYSMDVGTLPAGASELAFAPVVGGVRQCSRRATLNAAADPMVGLFTGVKTRWNSDGYYAFDGTLPKVPGLPVDLPLNVKYLGDLGTRMSAGLRIRGILELNQVMTIDILDAELLAKIVGQNLLNQRRSLLPPGPGYVSYNPSSPRTLAIPVEIDNLASVFQDITFFRGTIFSWFGIFNLNGAVGARFGAGLAFRATIYPLQPRVDATLTAGGFVGGWLEFSADLLGGLVEGGVRGGIDAIINLPLGVDVGSPAPGAEPRANVGLRTPCFLLRGYMQPYASAVWGLFKKRFSPITLFDVRQPARCSSITPGQLMADQTAEEEATLPRVLPQTALATGAGGRTLALAIEDAAPDAEAAAPRIVARGWDAAASAWGAPVPLTDGARLVDRPALAFYGDGTRAMAAWAQLGLSEAASADPANTPLDQLRSFEIYVAEWDGVAWGAPVQLTDDELPDGRPSIAGGAGGLTLAWVRDMDGDASTPGSRIAVSEWASGAWSAPLLLGSGGRNTQVSVARVERGCPVGCAFYQRRAALAWTNDEDGSDATVADRTLRLATRIPGSDASWEDVPPPTGAPFGVDSPSVAIGDGVNGAPLAQLNLAFTELPVDEEGRPIHVSDLATLWAGYTADLGAGWEGAASVQLEDGTEIRAQRPLIQAGPGGETLLLFRRFGAGGTTATLGQLALARGGFGQGAQQVYSSPAYLSGGYRQHWQHALAIDSAGAAVVLGESRPYARTARDEAELRTLMADIPTVGDLAAIGGAGGLVWASMPQAADPALDPALGVAQPHAPAGTTVEVTALVRNRGRAPLPPGGVVRFYRGTPAERTLLDQLALPELGFNEQATLRFPVGTDGTQQPIFAEISSAGDSDETNNRAFAELGTPVAPELLGAAPTSLWPDAIELSLAGPPPAGLEGYRIYRRAASADASVELVGEAAGARFYDLLLRPGETYCYSARSFDNTGLLSPPSPEVCATATPGNSLYLPLLRR
jgi:hypothetical protein